MSVFIHTLCTYALYTAEVDAFFSIPEAMDATDYNVSHLFFNINFCQLEHLLRDYLGWMNDLVLYSSYYCSVL